MLPSNSNESALKTADSSLSKVEDAFNMIAALAIFSLMLLGVAQIVLRKFFSAPISGYIDLVELSMATFAFLGAAYCQRLGGHIRMEILMSKFHGRTLWVVEVTGTLVALIAVGVLVWFGWDHFMRSFTLGDTTIDAEYPVWPSKLLVPIAFSVWFLRLGLQLWGFLRLAINPKRSPVAVPVLKDVTEQAQDEIKETFGSNERSP